MDLIPEKDFKKMRDECLEALENHPEKEELKKNLIVGDDFIFKINNRFSKEELEGLSDDDRFYYPICTKEEIKKINSCNSSGDYLLKIRADSIADNIRFHRVFLDRYKKHKGNWSLSGYFETKPFTSYINRLSKANYNKCIKTTAGFAFLKEATGKCIYNKYGNIILVSESLSDFLYYMNLSSLDLGYKIPPEDKFYALLIGIRIMLGSETLDFDLDPRGTLPESLHNSLLSIVNKQIEFVIGHEFAHHILEHGNRAITKQCVMSDIIQTRSDSPITFYNYRQKQEFQADWFAIKKARYNKIEKNEMINWIFLFFMHLDFVESVIDYLNPANTNATHPSPISRIWRLRKKINNNFGDPPEILDKTLQRHIEFKKFFLKEIVPFHTYEIEKKGSMYLPSFKTDKLIDRVDY